MTQRSVEPPAPPTRGHPLERVQRWVQVRERRIRRIPLVISIQRVLDTYNAAGGGITSSGLSYGALFAVIPGLLLIVSLLVILVDGEAARQQVIDWIITQVPPLQEFAKDIVASVTQQARVGSVIGLVLFIWGASGFYLALEGAMERLFPGPKRRDPIMGRIRGAIAVVLVVGSVLAMFVASTIATGFGLDSLLKGVDAIVPVGGPVVAVSVSSFVCLIVYVLVPADTPGWRAAWAPALAAGIGIGLLTSLFGLVSQYLVGGFSALGALTSVFVALVWFNWVFQMLLYGGAWARLRRDRRHARGVPR
jgi:YihY family inner membrane protein